MRIITPILIMLTVAACGADGEPLAPASGNGSATGLTVSGEAKIGVSTVR
jgi:hypothetical protein